MTPTSEQLETWDRRHYWHGFTQMADYRPLVFSHAEGPWLYDIHGKKYLDGVSSLWCNVHGHNHPEIKKAINNQLKKLDHTLFSGFTHKPAIKLAEKLVSITPSNLTKVFYSDNGSTAVETALKMSFQYWLNSGKRKKKEF